MTSLSPTAIRIRNADAADPSGVRGTNVYDQLVQERGQTDADELWVQAINELDEYNDVERTEA